jgi:hypothetical protein
MFSFSEFKLFSLEEFKKYPKSTKKGFLFLYVGWALFFINLYMLLQEVPNRILIIAAIICFFVIKGYNWARMLCLLCNVLIVIYASFFVVHLFRIGLASQAGLLGVTVVLFAASSYYLFIKETSEYFKSLKKNVKYEEPKMEYKKKDPKK